MGDNEPESRSLSPQVQGAAQWAKEPSTSCKEGPLEPGGQQSRHSPQSSRAELPVADVKGDQCGVEQHSGVWSSWCGTCLSYTHESNVLFPSGSLDKCLGTPDGEWDFPQDPVYGWSCSSDTAVLVTCADILGVSPCQVCLLGSFPLEPRCHG